METSIINFIINNLFLKSLFMKDELQKKILSLVEIDSYKKDNKNIKECSSFSVHNLSLNSLFDICKFKSKEEIIKELKDICNYLSKQNKTISVNEDKISVKFIETKTNIAKKSMPLLLKKCKEEMKKYLENKKGEANNSEISKEKIIYILQNLKDLNYIYNEDDEKNYNNSIMKECLKSKKGHLFMMHSILGEFITVQDNDIINIIKDIFKIISQEIGLKNDN